MAAAARRFVFSQTPVLEYSNRQRQQEQKLTVEAQVNLKSIQNLGYLGHDLVKIVILAFMIIAAQIFLALFRA